MRHRLLVLPLVGISLGSACGRQEQSEALPQAHAAGNHTMAGHDSMMAGHDTTRAHRMGGMMDDPDRQLPTASGPTLPAGWEIRLDRLSAPREDFQVRSSEAGLAVVNGPAAILYRTENPLRVSGDFTIGATVRQLERPRHPEGYGLFFGGEDLQGPNQRYGYFIVRSDGKFMVKRREGDQTFTLVPWTEHRAVRAQGEDGQQENALAVRVAGDEAVFLANGTEVARVARNEIPTDGIVGYRVNHNLNVWLGEIQRGGRR
jgi:hypothetical protein